MTSDIYATFKCFSYKKSTRYIHMGGPFKVVFEFIVPYRKTCTSSY